MFSDHCWPWLFEIADSKTIDKVRASVQVEFPLANCWVLKYFEFVFFKIL